MVEFWEAEQELEFDVHDMILSEMRYGALESRRFYL